MQGRLVRCPFPNGGCVKESGELDISLCLVVWWLQVLLGPLSWGVWAPKKALSSQVRIAAVNLSPF